MIFAALSGLSLSPGHHLATTGDDLALMVRSMQGARERAFDFEGNGLRWANGDRPIGYSMGYIPAEGGWPVAWYVPFGHHDPTAAQADPEQARRAFGDALRGAGALIGHNLKFDLNYGRAAGFEIPEDAPLHDSMIQAYLTYEKRALGLEAVAEREGVSRWGDPFEAKRLIDDFLATRAQAHRLPMKKDDKRSGRLSYMSRFGHSEVPVAIEAEYACRDVSHTLCVDHKLRSQAQGAGREFEARRRWLYDHEMVLVRALAEMEWHGQEADRNYLIDLGNELEIDCAKRSSDLNRLFGVAIDWSKDEHVRGLLYDRLRLPVVKMTDGGRFGTHRRPAVDREAIQALAGFDPRLAEVAEYKARLKALQSFTFSLAYQVGDDGKIHASFLQHGTDSGRFSSRDPNFQNIPKRHKYLSKAIRKGWPIRPGMRRLYCDYSQIELRMLAWVCQAKNFLQAYRSPAYDALCRGEIDYDTYRWQRRAEPEVDIHGDICTEVFGIRHGHEDWEIKRRAAKVVNFGVPYGGGYHLLSGNPELRMDPDVAKAFLADYHSANPEITITRDRLFTAMRYRSGVPWFVNWAGRTVHGPRLRHGDDDVRAEEERSLFACLIQGSAAELTRISLVRWYKAYKAGQFPGVATSTIHDEIQYDMEQDALPYCASEAQRIGEGFVGRFGSVPVILDLQSSATTWADAKGYDFWAEAA